MKYKYLCVCLVFLLSVPMAIAQSKYKVVANENNISKIVSCNNLSWKQWEENLYEQFVRDLVFNKWVDMPQYYTFEIKFDVSADGKISNIRIKGKRGDCDNTVTPKLCMLDIKESEEDLLYNLKFYSNQILKSYENTSILKFPKNAKVKNKTVTIFAIRTAHLLDDEWQYGE